MIYNFGSSRFFNNYIDEIQMGIMCIILLQMDID